MCANFAQLRRSQIPLSGPPRLTDDRLRAAIDYIHDHIGESLELRSISQAAGLSEFHFARLFKAATGATPFQFVTRIRIKRAKELLRKTRVPILEIAERFGYRKPSHFSARFRAVSGCGSGCLPQVHWTLIAGRGASSATFQMLRARPPKAAEPALPG